MSVSRRVLATALLSFGLHGVAGATPIYYSDVSAGATLYYNSGATLGDGEHQREATRNLGPVDASLTGASAWASVTEVADPVSNLRTVQLHAFAHSDGPLEYGYVSASASAMFFETLVLTSDFLPEGTPVEILAELNPSWTVTPNASALCYGRASAGLEWINSRAVSGRQFVAEGTCDQADANTSTGNIQGIIGQELTFYIFLQAGAGIAEPITIDASHTLTLLLTPQGNFSYVAASGNAYVNIEPTADVPVPVPEPTTMLLLGAGLVLGARRVRQRGRSGH